MLIKNHMALEDNSHRCREEAELVYRTYVYRRILQLLFTCARSSPVHFSPALLHSRSSCNLYWCYSMPVNMKAAVRATSNLNEMLAVLRIQATAMFPTTCILYNPYLQLFALHLPPHTSPAATQILPGFLQTHVFMMKTSFSVLTRSTKVCEPIVTWNKVICLMFRGCGHKAQEVIIWKIK